MSDYLVSGKKGAGKSVYCVGVIRDALLAKKRVATNLDIYVDKLVPASCRTNFYRLPDRPSYEDMIAIGLGQDGVEEDDNGVMVLDEASAYLNARSWSDKSRQPFLDWIIHSRKYGWDIYFIAQGASQLDKQLRETQIEYHVGVKNTKKWPIPFLTPIFYTLFGIRLTFPKLHLGIIKQGLDVHALRVGRKWFKGTDLYDAYDTQQIFYDPEHPKACALHTVLSAYYVRGRYLNWIDMNKKQIFMILCAGLIIGSISGFSSGYKLASLPDKQTEEVVIDESIKIIGMVQEGLILSALLSDGRSVPVSGEKIDKKGHFYKLGEKWVKR